MLDVVGKQTTAFSKMKATHYILIIIFSIADLSVYSQINFGEPQDSINFKTEIDPNFFLLGTLSDYSGRFQYVNRESQIDRYYPYEESLTKYISNFIKEYYLIDVDTVFKATRHSEIYSPKLAQEIHSKYFDKNGYFIDSTLNSEVKKYSFLTGVYYRYGENLEKNIYKIQVANSPKDKEIYQILKDLDCDKLVYKFLRGHLPSSDIFYFEATPRMIKYFNTIKQEKQELLKSYYKYIGKFEGEDGIKMIYEWYKEVIKSLQIIFK